jgi:hypothetical protein
MNNNPVTARERYAAIRALQALDDQRQQEELSKLMSEFKIGDRIRSMDFKGREDCFVEIVINIIDPVMRTYTGLTVRDVCEGEEVTNSSRVGFPTRCRMSGALHRDWPERLQLVATAQQVVDAEIDDLFDRSGWPPSRAP